MSAERDKRVADAYREVCHRAHVYHGVTRLNPPSDAKKEVSKAELGLAAVRLAHALGANRMVRAESGLDPQDPEVACECDYCVAAGAKVTS